MYVVGTHILEKYSTTTFGDFVQERILKPLGMNSTVTSTVVAKRLTQTWSKSGRRIPFWFSEEEMSLLSGAGSILSTTKDMVSLRNKANLIF